MRLLIVDDHNLFLEGVSALLTSRLPNAKLEVCEDIDQACATAQSKTVDLVISDIYMPGFPERNLVDLFIKKQIFVPILLVSATDDTRLIQQFLNQGAAGFVHKGSDPEELLIAINEIMENGTYLSDELNEALCQLDAASNQYLSKRQNEVLILLSTGLSNRAIGERLGLREATIKSHVAALFDIFNASNRLECVRKAQQLGLL